MPPSLQRFAKKTAPPPRPIKPLAAVYVPEKHKLICASCDVPADVRTVSATQTEKGPVWECGKCFTCRILGQKPIPYRPGKPPLRRAP